MMALAALMVALLRPSAVIAGSWCNAPSAPEARGLYKVPVEDSWFVVLKAAPGVFAISEPRQAEQVNSFLIVGSVRAVLFDTGLGIGQIGPLVRQLTTLPVTVVNSHTHFDHVGGNSEFVDVRSTRSAFSAAAARGEASPELSRYASSTLDADHICGTLSADVRRPYATRPWRVRSYVDDGDVLPLGGRQLEVIFTPGHTPDSLCLLDRQNGLLFTGDTFYSGEIYLWAAETNLEDYRRSINRLAALVPALVHLFPAHGPPIASPQRLLEVKSAFSLVQNSSAAWTLDAEHRRLYRFGAFSFLLAAK